MADSADPAVLRQHEKAIKRVLTTRAAVATAQTKVDAAKAKADEAVREALQVGVTPVTLSARVGVSNRVWVYAARSRAEAAAEIGTDSDG